MYKHFKVLIPDRKMKKINSILKLIVLLAVAYYLSTCANPSSPTGGPKDTVPPNLILSTPEHLQVDYHGNMMRLTFDEEIQVNDLKNQLIITPLVTSNYKVKAKKSTISIFFEEEPLAENTTYTFNFREGIRDLNEKNPAEVRISFSTGLVLDSLEVSGIVEDYLTKKEQNAVSIVLYDAMDTFDINNGLPMYMSRSDKKGRFSITNIKGGKYFLYAIKEKNNDYKYNPSGGEEIAFLEDTLILNKNFEEIHLGIFKFDVKTPKKVNTIPSAQYTRVIFNKSFVDYEVSFLDSTLNDEIFFRQKKSNLIFYRKGHVDKEQVDSIPAFITIYDSLKQSAYDTVKLSFGKYSKLKAEKYTVSVKPSSNSKMVPGEIDDISILFSKPTDIVNLDSILVFDEKDTIPFIEWGKEFSFENHHNQFDIKNVTFGDNIGVLLKKGTFVSVEGDTSESKTLIYFLKDEKDFGLVSGKIVFENEHQDSIPPFFIELLNGSFKVEQTLYNTTVYEFKYVSPGKKNIRVVLDYNQNNQWDQGDFLKKELPEPIYLFPKKIEVKPNWEILDTDLMINRDQLK